MKKRIPGIPTAPAVAVIPVKFKVKVPNSPAWAVLGKVNTVPKPPTAIAGRENPPTTWDWFL
jgi:hypothetical protein